ncbi:type II toxin-antitoxin system PemK/MazF family toxin [Bacillus sp. SD088]|uniref:type II toxin-antitoxin system PemK/MazF family toxin n=1 Tax=Bacillus sp. SD088 TaxID=2782012 RepID=UPI001A971FE7|nr:type II toxin-antitoxin system PemK/MazF family toxin [Bacillus sp. SD088]MBO0995607.1 type II toxin-antitoxin system PemK/MazF family toxin [Bacillus sp. SD088]
MVSLKKGDIVFMQFDPQSGHEQAGYRPAIVLSKEIFNSRTHFAVVCPITRQKKGYPFEVELPEGLEVEGVILTDQPKSMDCHSRNVRVVGQAPESTVHTCIKRIHTFLSLD